MALKPLVVLCVLVAASFSFLLGYDIGIMSGAKRLVARDLKLDSVEVEVLVGILNIVSAFGGLASGRLADAAGRRCTVGLACAVCIVGSLLMAVATSYSALLVGRVITGFGIGSSFQVSPLYIAEVAPKSLRGRLVTMFDLFINVGILAGYVVGYVVGSQLGLADGPAWRLMLGLGAVPPLLILLALPVMPESPRYLVASGQHERAWGVLQRLYAPHEARATMSLLRDEGGGALPSTWQGLRQIFCPAPGVTRSLLLAGLGAACLQQATGVEAAVYYTPETLEAVGITEERSLLLATVGVGAIKARPHPCPHPDQPPKAAPCALSSAPSLVSPPSLQTLRLETLPVEPPPSALHPPPSTLHPPPSALRPPPSALHPPPSTLRPPPSALRLPTDDVFH
jgi:MFS family permease